MTDTTDLVTQIETLVREHFAQTQREVAAALERAFTSATPSKPARNAAPVGRKRRAAGVRRDPQVVEALAEKLHEAVCARPGEGMTVFAEQLGVSVRDLHRPMTKLKGAGRLRVVGERSQARYFPGLPADSGAQ